MSNATQREQKMFDTAAEQARNEGTSSFGIGFNRKSECELNKYRTAAEERGLMFVVDEDGAGLFVEH